MTTALVGASLASHACVPATMSLISLPGSPTARHLVLTRDGADEQQQVHLRIEIAIEPLMATRDITDLQVVQAYQEMRRQEVVRRLLDDDNATPERADVILQRMTDEDPQDCWCAMDRAWRRGLVDCASNLASGWLTDKGRAMLGM